MQRLVDEQWSLLAPLLEKSHVKQTNRGRPRLPDRDVLDGILWVLKTGAQWNELPGKYPPYQTCHRRFQEWVRSGVLAELLRVLAQDMEARGGISLEECFIDGTSAPAKKGALVFGKTKKGKGTKLMVICDGESLPVAIHVGSASPHEVTLVDATLACKITRGTPKRLVADKAYDSDPLDTRMQERGIDVISPHQGRRVKPKTQDGRKLRRYRRRWKIERLNAWLQNFRRLTTRFDYKLENYVGFVHLACIPYLTETFLRWVLVK
ncbi:MAG TPA: IS5 family transposase [Candidatus Saccharimonadales bacterium]|nr:IS5 family transposase [Candidatus Saccharimonadales bacterium]